MAVPTDNNTSVKQYNYIRKYNDPEIEIEKIRHLKTLLEIVGYQVRIQKGTDKHVNMKPGDLSQYNTQKLLFAELLIFLEEYYFVTEKYHLKRQEKYKFLEYI